VPLQGTVEVRGAKNAALPILFATVLTDARSVIRRVPYLRDVTTTLEILTELGMRCERLVDGSISVEVEEPETYTAPYEKVCEMRASICTLGPLLARRKRARVSKPGGCSFGMRPIDLHLKGLAALGADIRTVHGFIEAEADTLRGATIYLGGPFGSSVLATANVMMAATLAKGTTVIEAAACEPEVADLGKFLNAMGARIEHLGAVTDILRQAGLYISAEGDAIRVTTNGGFRPVDVTTLPYPGFPTDLQAQMMALLSLADGISVITEKIYPDRFIHISELSRLGANIRKEGPSAIINGVRRLSGAPVMASDLRASACLVLAGLVAQGVTEINRIYHLDRGYERIEERLSRLGALIRREKDRPPEDEMEKIGVVTLER
jgi:UDP-N-acetylglucosamine 1-carboxyvinyltransferase